MELVLIFIFIVFPFTVVYADTQGYPPDDPDLPLHQPAVNYQAKALDAFKQVLDDPTDVLNSWDTTRPLDEWIHISCDDDTNCDHVEWITLGDSKLAGPLVPELGNLDKLQYLLLYNNKIRGSIPAELGNLTNLLKLDLFDNSLTGSLPEELANLKSLRFFLLNDNNLSGSVPDALANFLKDVPIVNLSGNPNLCGAFTEPYKPC